MKVRHDEGVANRIGPEPCDAIREGCVEGRARVSRRVDGLPHAERLVFGLGQRPAGGRARRGPSKTVSCAARPRVPRKGA